MSSYMYAFLVGMCVALERRGDIVSCEAVFNQDPEAGGRIIDASQRLFAKGSVLGLRRTQLEKLFPGVQYSTLDPGAHCEEYMVFARACHDQSPHVEVEECNRIFLSVGANQQPSIMFEELSRTLVPHWGHTLIGASAPSKYLSKTVLLLALRRAKKDAASYNHAHQQPGTHEAQVSTANRAYGKSTNVTLRLANSEAGVLTETTDSMPVSSHRFPGGSLFTLAPGAVKTFLRELPLQYLWPVPRKVLERLERLGFRTIGQVARTSHSRLSRLLGTQAEAVYRYAQPNFPTPLYEQVSRFEPDENVTPAQRALLTAETIRLARQLEQALSRDSRSCGQLALDIDLYGGTTWHGTRRFIESGRGQRQQPGSLARGLELPALALLDDFLATIGDSDSSTDAQQELTSIRLEAADLQVLVPGQLSLQDLARPGPCSDRQANRRQLGELLAALKTRFPNTTLCVGADNSRVSRREQMLRLIDPYRQHGSAEG